MTADMLVGSGLIVFALGSTGVLISHEAQRWWAGPVTLIGAVLLVGLIMLIGHLVGDAR